MENYLELGSKFENISAVTLDQKMSAESKLVIFSFLLVLGFIINFLHMLCFFFSQKILKEGLFFLWYVALSDIIIVLLVIPATLGALFSKSIDTPVTCHVQYFISLVSVYAYGLLTLANACEFSLKTKCSTNLFSHKTRISIYSFLLICFSLALAALGVYGGLDYDYCEQKHVGDYMFRYSTFVGFIFLPMLGTFIFLVKGFIRARENKEKYRNRKNRTGKRTYFIIADENVLPLVNLLSYLFYVIMWLPYVIRIHFYPKGNPRVYINLAVFALSRSVFAPCLYWSDNTVRGAYVEVFQCFVDRVNCRKEIANSDEDKKKHPRKVNFRLSRLDHDAGDQGETIGSDSRGNDPL